MTQKTYYYHFNKIDTCFWSLELALILAVVCSCCYISCTGNYCQGYDRCSIIAWGMVIFTLFLWIYKNVLKQVAVIITDDTIKIDHCAPLAWKDIKDGEIKTVRLCRGKMKILSLNPKKGIKYHYNWLQRNNGDFGAFPIPLYGVLTPEDEKEIVQIVKKHVKIK